MREKAAVIGGLSQYCDLRVTRSQRTLWSLIICILVLTASDRLSLAADTSLHLNVLVLHCFTRCRALDDLETLKSATRSIEGSYLESIEEEKNPGKIVPRVLSGGK